MKILKLSFSEPHPLGWRLDELAFRPDLNLIVGASGAGKSRILNVINNISLYVIGAVERLGINFSITFSHQKKTYIWDFRCDLSKPDEYSVDYERIEQLDGDTGKLELVNRGAGLFNFTGSKVPKLAKEIPAIRHLKEEDAISPLFDAFKNVKMRNFPLGDMRDAYALSTLNFRGDSVQMSAAEIQRWLAEIPSLNAQMWIIQSKLPEKFANIKEQFKKVFPFVEDLRVEKISQHGSIAFGQPVPAIQIKEHGSNNYVSVIDISSGMQKVLLIVIDVIAGNLEQLHMYDEYENSLGTNAIDFFGEFIDEFGAGKQFLVTSHHPQLINSIPAANWYLVSRQGLVIKVDHGAELERRYGKSKHQRFTQLLNDPIYKSGVL